MRSMMIVLALISLVFSALPSGSVIAQEGLPECNVRDKDKPDEPAWNRESCYRGFLFVQRYTWLPPLAECLYHIQSGPLSELLDCQDVEDWYTACDCYGIRETTCMIAVYIGPDELCNTVGEGTCRICAKVADIATPPQVSYGEHLLDIDFAPPSTVIECNDDDCKTPMGWYEAGVEISLHCDDGDGSGCAETYYCVDQSDDCEPDTVYTEPFHVSAEGANYIRFSSKDIAGNTEAVRSEAVRIGETAEETPWHSVLVIVIIVLVIVGLTTYSSRRKSVQKG